MKVDTPADGDGRVEQPAYRGPLIDTCVHHHWATQEELMEFMAPDARFLLGRRGAFPGGRGLAPVVPMHAYSNPLGDKLKDATPVGGGPAGSDRATLVNDVLGEADDAKAILVYDVGALLPAHNHHYLALEACRAANSWCIERWLSTDRRLFSLVLAPNHLPEEAAKEIRRVGDHPQMVGVLMCANGIGKPFGHPLYHPIYAAAAEMDLPVVIHAGGDDPVDILTHTTASGDPLTYGEYHALLSQPLTTHIVSLMAQGVFEMYPRMKVLLTGAGVAWMAHVVARFEMEYKATRIHAPWMKRRPTEYLNDNVRLATYPMDRAPSMQALVATLSAMGPPPEDLLCFGSGYPNWDATTPDEVAGRLPSEWWNKAFHDNAAGLFRLPPLDKTSREHIAATHS